MLRSGNSTHTLRDVHPLATPRIIVSATRKKNRLRKTKPNGIAVRSRLRL